MFNGQAALRVSQRLGIPLIYQIRAFWEDDAVDKLKISDGGLIYRTVKNQETAVAQQADHVACICEGLRNDLIERGIAPDKIILVKNGVQPDAFTPMSPDPLLVDGLGLKGKRVLGFIGSFFHYEGLPDLVDAVAELRKQRDDFVLLLVGGGEDEAVLHTQVKELGLDDCVRFTGRVPHEDVAAHYSVVDTFVYPRRPKRLTELVTPLKPLEAAAMERCVIGSDVGGIRELLDELNVGRTFKAGDAADLVRVLNEALDRDTASLQAEGRMAREAVLERRSWERTLTPLRQLYESIGR
jgi:PEP-CTERM/exosortase A-associated glycosyltransferase